MRDRAGVLAPGNHFVELHAMTVIPGRSDLSSDDLLLIVHNGRLEAGALVQKYALRLAAGSLPLTTERLPLLSLRAASAAGAAYRMWLRWATRFAAANRTLLASRATAAFFHQFGRSFEVWPLSDRLHSGISRVSYADTVRWRHQSGTQALHPNSYAFIGGTVGGDGYLVTAGEEIAASFETIRHGSGECLAHPGEITLRHPVTNLAPAALATLQARFRDVEATIRSLTCARLTIPVARTHPVAIVKRWER